MVLTYGKLHTEPQSVIDRHFYLVKRTTNNTIAIGGFAFYICVKNSPPNVSSECLLFQWTTMNKYWIFVLVSPSRSVFQKISYNHMIDDISENMALAVDIWRVCCVVSCVCQRMSHWLSGDFWSRLAVAGIRSYFAVFARFMRFNLLRYVATDIEWRSFRSCCVKCILLQYLQEDNIFETQQLINELFQRLCPS